MNNIAQPSTNIRQKINNIYSVLFSRKTLLALSAVGLLVFIASMWNRFIYIDDAFFGEQAYWLAKDGIVKTPSLIDFLGCDIRLFSYHKLSIYVGAALIRIFGWSVNPLRIATLVFLMAFLVVFYRFFRENKNKFDPDHFIIAVFFILFNPLSVLYSFTFRSEIWVMFFGFLSYYFIDKSIRKDFQYKYIIAAGIISGLAFLTHLNGLIFPVAGFTVLALSKKWKALLLFSLASGTICLLYFFDLWQDHHFATWLYQLKNWPDNNATNYLSDNFWDLLLNVFYKLGKEHQLFFWSDQVAVISAFFLLAIVSNFKNLLREHFILIIYTLMLIITLNVAGGQIAERFLIYLFPFMAIIIAIDLVGIKNKISGIKKSFYLIFLILQIVFVSKMFMGIFQRNNDYTEISKNVLARIPDKNALTLIPYTLIFNGLNEYNLASYKGFEYYQVSVKHPLTQQEFFKRAATLNIKYIVVPVNGSRSMSTGLQCIETGAVEINPYYREFARANGCIYLVRI